MNSHQQDSKRLALASLATEKSEDCLHLTPGVGRKVRPVASTGIYRFKPSGTGYKDTPTAHGHAAKLVSNGSIHRAVPDQRAARSKRLEITADRVRQEPLLVDFSDSSEIGRMMGARFTC
jgi:hypothetical protein